MPSSSPDQRDPGRSSWAPIVSAPGARHRQRRDTGRFGTAEQKADHLDGLLSGEIFSWNRRAVRSPVFTTARFPTAITGVISGRKVFSPNASVASFFIVVAITDPDVPVHRGASTFLIPAGTRGLNVEATHHLVGSLPHEAGHFADPLRQRASACQPCSPANPAAASRSCRPGWPAAGSITPDAFARRAQRALDMTHPTGRRAGSPKAACSPTSNWCGVHFADSYCRTAAVQHDRTCTPRG